MHYRDELAKDILYALVYRRRGKKEAKAMEMRLKAQLLAEKILAWEQAII